MNSTDCVPVPVASKGFVFLSFFHFTLSCFIVQFLNIKIPSKLRERERETERERERERETSQIILVKSVL
jgi:large-conductance mechanosensitive channel